MVCASVTCFEDRVATIEANEKLTITDRATVQRLLKRLDTLDSEFKTHHFAVVDLVEEETLGEEQAVLDDHDDKVLLLTERLQRLVGGTGAVIPPRSTKDPSQLLCRRLCDLESSLRSINLTVESLTSGPDLDACLVQHLHL